MKTAMTCIVGLTLLLVGCEKKDPASSAAASATGAATPAPAPSPSPAEAPAASASAAGQEAVTAQKGLAPGEVVVGYLQDLKDEGQCAALPVKEGEKAQYDAKKIEQVAKMMKAKVVDKCPSENVQGTCKMMGMLVSYTGPKYTPESAKKNCAENRGKWID